MRPLLFPHACSLLLPVRPQASRGSLCVVAAKKGIHPEWHPEAPVMCNGQQVMTVGGTKKVYNVDLYSGNHPFYQGINTAVVIDEGQLNKFKRRFADLEDLSTVVTANQAVAAAGGPAAAPQKAAPAPQKGGKGKKK